MGHVLFVILHLAALIFGFWALILTVPLHMIYSAMARPASSSADGDEPGTQRVRCPECRELVRADARKCKHCGVELQPAAQAPVPPMPRRPPNPALGYTYIAMATLICIALIAKACTS